MREWIPVPGSPKSRLLAAGTARFEAEGFERAAVTAIARDAGTTTGALYHHFGSKQGLFDAIREEMERRVRDRMEGAHAALGGGRAGLTAALLVGFDAAVRFGAARILSDPAAPTARDALVPALRALAADAPPDLVATIREAQANAQLIGASDLPQVDVQGSAARSRSETGIVETNSATLGVSWLVDLFGSTRAARQGASARLDAAYLSAEVARLTGFVRRWVEELVERYNRFGPASLGDRRRGNGAKPKILTPEVLATLRERVQSPPDDGGVWTAKKAAAVMAVELGLASVAAQRGWEALRAIGWTIQRPRPQHARAATPKEQEAFKNVWPAPSARGF